MPSHTDAQSSSSLVREAIPFPRLPWIRPLVDAYAHDFGSVSTLFRGNPADPAAWADTIARVGAVARDRAGLGTLVGAQLTRRGAPAAALASAARLADPRAVVVITGQQAGFLGGPLYTLLKAITTIQLARAAEQTHGVPVVPVFWVDADDHDWAEVRTAHVLDKDFGPAEISLDPPEGAGTRPVGTLMLDDRVTATLDRLEQSLAPTEFTSDLLQQLRRRYRPGAGVAEAFAGWLDDLLGAEGLVVFDAGDPAAKAFAAPIFRQELEHSCETARLARDEGAKMTAAGHAPQIEPGDDVVCVFYVDEQGRRPVRCRDGRFTIGDEPTTVDALLAHLAEHPERFSPNVLLRPIVQDRIFPTICYVAGPSELAYHVQLSGVYRAFGVPAPLLASRASATLVDSAAARFLGKVEIPFESLQVQDESALNRLLENQLPPSLDETFAWMDARLVEGTARLKPDAVAVDPTLGGAVDTTLDRLRDTVKNLHGKIVQASKKKDDTLRRQFTRTRSLTFPNGEPQERLLSVAFFINRHGPALSSRLLQELPTAADAHYILTP